MTEISSARTETSKLPPKDTLRQFLSLVWNRDDVTEKTINYRKQFTAKFNLWCQDWKLDPNSVCAVLAGSSRRNVKSSGESDWDFILYGPDKLLGEFETVRHEKRQSMLIDEYSISMDSIIHPVMYARDSEIKNNGAALLVTPDNYVAGNIKYAQRLRKRTAQTIKIDDVEFRKNTANEFWCSESIIPPLKEIKQGIINCNGQIKI